MDNLLQHVDTLYTYDLTPKHLPLGLDFTVINIIILVANLLITLWINIIGYKRRRRSDRTYQMSLDLYKMLIINNFTAFISHVLEVEKFFIQTVNSNEEDSEHLKLIERNFEKIEDIQSKFYSEKIPFVISFSPQMANELKSFAEVFYNNVGTLLSKMNSPLPERNKGLLTLFSKQREIYNNKFYGLIKKYQPSA